MKDIKYKVEFFSNWHCGSGLAAGADVDALVIKDKNELPYIPGKTMKGLIREAVEDILFLTQNEKVVQIRNIFGFFEDDKDMAMQGCSFFTNATLSQPLQEQILGQDVARYLYRSFSSTAIEENGIARDHSLRRIQTTIPCVLEGAILNVPDEFEEEMINGLKYIKRLGLNRNRGLGRCQFTVIEGGNL